MYTTLSHPVLALAVWHSGSALFLINEVNLCRVRLVLGWVTVSWFDSWGRQFISVRKPAIEVDSAFCPPRVGKLSTSPRAVML